MNFLSASLSLTHKYAYILIVPHALFYSNRMVQHNPHNATECGWCFLVTAWSVVHWNTSPSITAHMNADINLMQTTVVVSLHFVNGISEL